MRFDGRVAIVTGAGGLRDVPLFPEGTIVGKPYAPA